MTETTRRTRALLLVMVLAALGMLTTALPIDHVLARAAVGAPLALLLPGFALTEACLSRGRLGGLERFVFTVGASLAITILGGVALHLTPWGIQPRAWALLLGSVTIGASVVALGRSRPDDVAPRRARGERNGPAPVIPLALAGALALGAVIVATQGARRQPVEDFTVLAIAPLAGEPAAVTISVHNREGTTTGYRLEARQAGAVTRAWPAIDLEPEERWEETVVWPTPPSDPVEVVLYRAAAPAEPYRRVVWWPGTGGAGDGGE